MDMDKIKEIMPRYDGRWKEISFGGGEPKMYPKLDELFSLFVDDGWDILLHTNFPELGEKYFPMFTNGDNNLTVVLSYNSEVEERMPGLLDRIVAFHKTVKDISDPRIKMLINVFDIEYNNRLIDLGFKKGEVVKVPIYRLGRAKDLAYSVPIDTAEYEGDIYTTDMERFTVREYTAACDHQSTLN
jgi:hypothetical protein